MILTRIIFLGRVLEILPSLRLAREAERLRGWRRETAFSLDETSFVEKMATPRSACSANIGSPISIPGFSHQPARQSLAKLENWQAGVFACPARGDRAALIDFRLFLPEACARDKAHCAKVKVPAAERVHGTKVEPEQVKVAQVRDSSHQRIGGDESGGRGGGGDKRGFDDGQDHRDPTDALVNLGETLLTDVASTTPHAPPPPPPLARNGEE